MYCHRSYVTVTLWVFRSRIFNIPLSNRTIWVQLYWIIMDGDKESRYPILLTPGNFYYKPSPVEVTARWIFSYM